MSHGRRARNSPRTSSPSTSTSRASASTAPVSKLADPAWSLNLDEHGIYARRAERLAVSLGEPAWRVVEEHAARAWARFCAGQSIEQANEGALGDIAERLARQEAA